MLTDHSPVCTRQNRMSGCLRWSALWHRITVRQLEALVRLSEALARLRCTEKIVPAYVREVCAAHL